VRFTGKRAFITGAARGQGRSHALALAREGCDVALIDIASGEKSHPPYRLATRDDLDETARLVKDLGRQAVSIVCDIRDEAQIRDAVDQAVSELGGLDYVVANAGVEDRFLESWNIPTEDWMATVNTNLNGTWLTCKYTIPHLITTGEGAAMVLVSSLVGLRPLPFNSDYVASKYGVTGLGLTLANELGPYKVRVNLLHPGAVDTPMVDAMAEANETTREALLAQFADMDVLGGGALQAEESTTPTVLWLLSDDAKWITGHSMVVDAGARVK
jgi:NAD(P)-dependent dehydrogenase (short-subunit alcohol dehydrogenase family)